MEMEKEAEKTKRGSMADLLDRHTREGALWRAKGDRIQCYACGHRCSIAAGRRGVCKVRYNENGRLRVPYGYVSGLQCDPVEKKPFFHVYPSHDAMTFGMVGCDYHCSYCQNWVTSQALRDGAPSAPIRPVTVEDLMERAHREEVRLVVSSYNEPLITAEWAVEIFKQAKPQGFLCAFISNGNATPEALDYVRPWIEAYKVDLKGFNQQRYRSLGGTLSHVLETIGMVHERGLWIEVVTLLVPGFNDTEEELRNLTRFLVSVNRDIPWHVTAFHPDYRMTDRSNTTASHLVRAAEIGTEEGLRYVYAGNAPGKVGQWENTRCPSCQETLIERFGYLVQSYRITGQGQCPACQTVIPGLWPGRGAEDVRISQGLAAYFNRLPRSIR